MPSKRDRVLDTFMKLNTVVLEIFRRAVELEQIFSSDSSSVINRLVVSIDLDRNTIQEEMRRALMKHVHVAIQYDTERSVFRVAMDDVTVFKTRRDDIPLLYGVWFGEKYKNKYGLDALRILYKDIQRILDKMKWSDIIKRIDWKGVKLRSKTI